MANSDSAIGVDIGGTKVLGGVVDLTGKILRTFRADTPREGGDALNQVIADVVAELQTTHKTESIGISAAGLVSNPSTSKTNSLRVFVSKVRSVSDSCICSWASS